MRMEIFNQKNFLILSKIGLIHTLVLPFFNIYICGITIVGLQKEKNYIDIYIGTGEPSGD